MNLWWESPLDGSNNSVDLISFDINFPRNGANLMHKDFSSPKLDLLKLLTVVP